MSTLVGLFYAKDNLKITVSNYIWYKDIFSQLFKTGNFLIISNRPSWPTVLESRWWSLKCASCILCREVKLLQRDVLGMTLNCIWRGGSNSKVLRSMRHPFIAITVGSTVKCLLRSHRWIKLICLKIIRIWSDRLPKNTSEETNTQKCKYERNSLTSRHKITLDGLACC